VKLTISDQSETRKDVIVTIDAETVGAEERKIVKQFIKEAKVRGFRPGKVPESRIRQLYAKEIMQELKRSLMNKAVREVSDQEDLELVAVVDFPEPGDPVAGQEITLDLTVDVVPPFELPVYEGLELEVPSTDVSDQEIDAAIDRIRRQRADFDVVERPAAVEDYVKVSYTPTLDGESIEAQIAEQANLRAWGAVKEGWEEAGTEEAKRYGVAEVIDAIVGMAAGETKSVEVLIPDEFPIESLRGKTVAYAITAHEVRERRLPELDEAYFKSVGAESLEDYKAQVLDSIEGQKRNERVRIEHGLISQKLLQSVEFDLPETMLEEERQQAVINMMGRSYEQGISQDELESHKDEIFAAANESANREVKLRILLSRIAEKEGIEVSNEDLSKAAYSVATQRRQKLDDYVKELQKDSAQLRQLQRQVLTVKTVNRIAEKAVRKIISQ
jgi:trigger factor